MIDRRFIRHFSGWRTWAFDAPAIGPDLSESQLDSLITAQPNNMIQIKWKRTKTKISFHLTYYRQSWQAERYKSLKRGIIDFSNDGTRVVIICESCLACVPAWFFALFAIHHKFPYSLARNSPTFVFSLNTETCQISEDAVPPYDIFLPPCHDIQFKVIRMFSWFLPFFWSICRRWFQPLNCAPHVFIWELVTSCCKPYLLLWCTNSNNRTFVNDTFTVKKLQTSHCHWHRRFEFQTHTFGYNARVKLYNWLNKEKGTMQVIIVICRYWTDTCWSRLLNRKQRISAQLWFFITKRMSVVAVSDFHSSIAKRKDYCST